MSLSLEQTQLNVIQRVVSKELEMLVVSTFSKECFLYNIIRMFGKIKMIIFYYNAIYKEPVYLSTGIAIPSITRLMNYNMLSFKF